MVGCCKVVLNSLVDGSIFGLVCVFVFELIFGLKVVFVVSEVGGVFVFLGEIDMWILICFIVVEVDFGVIVWNWD